MAGDLQTTLSSAKDVLCDAMQIRTTLMCNELNIDDFQVVKVASDYYEWSLQERK
jgi:hypothetical protein